MIGPSAALAVNWSGSVKTGPLNAVYFFKKKQYIRWNIDKEEIFPGYPKNISEGWLGLLDQLPDAEVSGAIYVPGWNNRIWFFFKGQTQVASWDVVNNCADSGLTPLQKIMPSGLVSGGGQFAPIYVDRNDTQMVYAFRGDEYTRFTVSDGEFPDSEDKGYPRKIGDGWTGGLTVSPTCGVSVNWPNRSKAQANHKLYFFLGNLYTRWDVASHSNNYRLDIPSGWKGWLDFE